MKKDDFAPAQTPVALGGPRLRLTATAPGGRRGAARRSVERVGSGRRASAAPSRGGGGGGGARAPSPRGPLARSVRSPGPRSHSAAQSALAPAPCRRPSSASWLSASAAWVSTPGAPVSHHHPEAPNRPWWDHNTFVTLHPFIFIKHECLFHWTKHFFDTNVQQLAISSQTTTPLSASYLFVNDI